MKGSSASTVIMPLFLVVVYGLIFAPLVSCDDKRPVITQISQEQIKDIGQEVEFNCTVQNLQDYPTLWIKLDKERQDRVPLSTDSNIIIRDKRFSLVFDNNTSTYSLKISQLKESDTGFYQCEILIDVNTQITREVELQINRPPTISRNTTRSVNVTEGQPIALHCYADGFPVPRILWKRENDLLLPIGGAVYRDKVLEIRAAHRDDRGVYYCVAENGVSPVVQGNATVNVEFAPVISTIRPRVGQASGYDATLECKIEARPRPIVTWLKNGIELRREDAKEQPGDIYIERYQRYSISRSDYGEYVCRAENKFGKTETKIQLFETELPVCGPSCG